MGSDKETCIEDIRVEIQKFVQDRQWEKYHTPKNIAMALSVEAAELLEHFQWLTPEESRTLSPETAREVREEIADVVTYAIELCNVMGIDLTSALTDKFKKNEKKYPVSEFRGEWKRKRE